MTLHDNDGNADNFECVSINIAQDFVKSIGSSQSDLALEYSELVIDGVLNETISDYGDILKSIPIAKTAVSAYNAYKGFSSFHFTKKLISFIKKVNERAASEKDTNWFREKFSESGKGKYEYIEYLLTVIDRYVGYDKPQMLAKLFTAFLDEYISWGELMCYAETLEKLLPGDYSTLSKSNVYNQRVTETPAAVLRLVGLGLMVETSRPSAFVPGQDGHVSITVGSLSAVQKNEIEYSRTTFGSKLVDIVQGNYSAK